MIRYVAIAAAAWVSIASVPKDGTEFCIHDGYGVAEVVSWKPTDFTGLRGYGFVVSNGGAVLISDKFDGWGPKEYCRAGEVPTS